MRRLMIHTVLVAATATAALSATGASAAITTIGSPLSGPATYNTTENLNYRGTDTALGRRAPEMPLGGTVHTYHSGADTAIWNTALAERHAGCARCRAGAAGQARGVRRTGCRRAGAADPDPPPGHHAAGRRQRQGGPHLPAVRRPGLRAERRQRRRPSPPTTRSTSAWRRGTTSTSTTRAGSSKSTTAAAFPTACSAPAPGSSADSFIKGGGTNNGATMSSGEQLARWKASPPTPNERTDAPGRVRHRARRDPHLRWRHQGDPAAAPGDADQRPEGRRQPLAHHQGGDLLQAEAPVQGHRHADLQGQGGRQERLRAERRARPRTCRSGSHPSS